jgi:hypothetical protein
MEKYYEPAPIMNRGKWTDEEQEMFLQCLAKHGRNYVILSDTIKTRTKTQIYTHVQSHSNKLEMAKLVQASKGEDVEMEDVKKSAVKRKRMSEFEREVNHIVMGVKAAETDKAAPCQVSVDSHEAKATPIVAKQESKGEDVEMEDATESAVKRKRMSEIKQELKHIVMGVNTAEADKAAPCQVSVDSHEAKATPIVAKQESKGEDVEMEDAKENGGKRAKHMSEIEQELKHIVVGVNAAEADKAAPCQVSVDSHEAKATPIVANANRVSLESIQPSPEVLSPPPAGLEVKVSTKTASSKEAQATKKVAEAETTKSSKALEVQVEHPIPVKASYQREDVQLLLSALAGALVVWVVRNAVL